MAAHVRDDLAPVREYARLLASIGINGCNLNNVNNAAPFLEPEMLEGHCADRRRHAAVGVRVALSVDVASPQKIGGLEDLRSARSGGDCVVERRRPTKSTS